MDNTMHMCKYSGIKQLASTSERLNFLLQRHSSSLCTAAKCPKALEKHPTKTQIRINHSKLCIAVQANTNV